MHGGLRLAAGSCVHGGFAGFLAFMAMPDVIVAGAGMAGLVAAADARARGAQPLVLEKLGRPGGAMRLSSGVVWRHRRFEDFRAECPGGDPALQRLVWERLDDDLAWLEALGAPVVERATRNPRTVGARFDVPGLLAALLRAAGDPQPLTALREPPTDGTPVVLATGGFAASREALRRHVTAEAYHVLLRAAPGATGDGLRIGLAAGGDVTAGMDEVYARLMPAPPARVREEDFVTAAQLYARNATVTNAHGESFAARTWSEVDVAQWTARQPHARAWLTLPASTLEERVRDRSVGEMVATAERLGAPVRRGGAAVVVECVAGVTTTLGGLRVDRDARVAPGVYAAGQDVGGVATGGYASGLAAALVLGRMAAAGAVRDARLAASTPG
jgi:fumarate reductase flavoprotein subunit